MQANPSKFQFVLLSNTLVDTCNVSLCVDDVVLKPESHVKILGVFLDDKLSFSKHISMCCTKAARQLNALARISRYLDMSSRTLLYNNFIRSNFNYCPMVWHFCGKVNNNKIEKIQERALRLIYKDYDSSYVDLLSAADIPTMLTRRLRGFLLEVFKSTRNLNSECLNDMFMVKHVNYSFRNKRIIVQPKRRNTTYGLRSISYLGAKLWNDNVSSFHEVCEIEYFAFKKIVENIDDLVMKGSDFPYL